MNAPCKDCPIRAIGCHANCDKYKDFRTEQDKVRAARNEYHLANPYCIKSPALRQRMKVANYIARDKARRGI